MVNTRDNLHLHEEVLLLALKDEKGTPFATAHYSFAMAGAMMSELLLAERIQVEDSKKKRVRVRSGGPLGNAELDECLALVTESRKERSLSHWVTKLSGLKGLKNRVATGLCCRGILRLEEDRVLLLFTRKVFPEIDPGPEREIIERLRNAIFTETRDVDPRTVILLSLARGAGLLGPIFDKKELKARKDRIEALCSGEMVGAATREAIQAVQAAVMVTTVIIPTVTS